jgi:hypothetical protein
MKTKVMYFAAPSRLMTREEIAGVFAKLGKDSEVTLALRQILTERTAEVVGAIADSRLPAEQRTQHQTQHDHHQDDQHRALADHRQPLRAMDSQQHQRPE